MSTIPAFIHCWDSVLGVPSRGCDLFLTCPYHWLQSQGSRAAVVHVATSRKLHCQLTGLKHRCMCSMCNRLPIMVIVIMYRHHTLPVCGHKSRNAWSNTGGTSGEPWTWCGACSLCAMYQDLIIAAAHTLCTHVQCLPQGSRKEAQESSQKMHLSGCGQRM
jgi:hypothetical protein